LAYRFTDARVFYNSTGEIERPFTAMHRALGNLSFHSRKDKWMADLTVNYIGSKRLPSTAGNPVEYRMDDRSPDYALVNAQVTRNFKKVAVYIGGENLTNVRQSRQIISPENPHSGFFDASFIWGPTFGAMVYTGVRWTF
jgi:outer membrane receptor protein involved in Fe transport